METTEKYQKGSILEGLEKFDFNIEQDFDSTFHKFVFNHGTIYIHEDTKINGETLQYWYECKTTNITKKFNVNLDSFFELIDFLIDNSPTKEDLKYLVVMLKLLIDDFEIYNNLTNYFIIKLLDNLIIKLSNNIFSYIDLKASFRFIVDSFKEYKNSL